MAEAGRAAVAEAVIMPRLDMTTEEMTILRWMKAEGEFVDKGAALLEVMTEKIAIEIDAPVAGYVRAVRYGVDEVVPVGEVIAYISAAKDGPLPAGAVSSSESGAEANSEVMATAVGSAGEAGAGDASAASADVVSDGGVRAAPLTRRIAAELGVDLGQVVGTGPGGRVLAEDVRSFVAARGDTGGISAAAPTGGAGGGGVPTGVAGADAGPVTETRLSPLRRAIARRMEASWRTAPHVTLTIDVDMSEATAFRARLRNASAAEGGDGRLTWNAFIAWVAVQALVRQPELNATLEGDVVRHYDDVHLGIAVDAPGGLLVPVVSAAQRLRPAALAEAIGEMVSKAVEGGLQPKDLSGASFTISNLGSFGIGTFTPIVNPPQVAILGVGAVQDKVIPVDGQPAVRPVCTFSLSLDHRAADGADGARYLALLKQLLLDPHRLIV